MYAKINKKTNTIIDFVEEPVENAGYYFVEMNKIEKYGEYDRLTYENGKVKHLFEKEKYDDINNLITNYMCDRKTHRLIKEWCISQPEGCEEAFFCMSHDSNRFKEYLAKKKEIKEPRKKAKVEIKSGLTLEDISEVISW